MKPASGEDGAVIVLVAVSMVVLLGAAAMSLDVGRIYQERRELQNGADAAALAVAHDCASGNCGASQITADQYADANASDGSAGIEFVDIDLGEQKVTVGTETDGASGSTFPMTLAQIVGFNGLTVAAEATVEWDALKAGPAFPILVRESLWDDLNPGKLSSLEEVTRGTVPDDRLVTMAHRSARDEADPASAAFEWLVESVDCSVDVEVGTLVEHRDGPSGDATPPSDCQGAGLDDVVDNVVLVTFFVGDPLDEDFDGDSSTKLVSGIGALFVTDLFECGDDDGFCITGYFLNDYVVNGPLGGNDFGVSAIRFVAG